MTNHESSPAGPSTTDDVSTLTDEKPIQYGVPSKVRRLELLAFALLNENSFTVEDATAWLIDNTGNLNLGVEESVADFLRRHVELDQLSYDPITRMYTAKKI
jgi:hypothetical protein